MEKKEDREQLKLERLSPGGPNSDCTVQTLVALDNRFYLNKEHNFSFLGFY